MVLTLMTTTRVAVFAPQSLTEYGACEHRQFCHHNCPQFCWSMALRFIHQMDGLAARRRRVALSQSNDVALGYATFYSIGSLA